MTRIHNRITRRRSSKSHKIFFDKLSIHLGHKSMEDWYNITRDNIIKNGGERILGYYGNSPSVALQTVYPKHNWMLWKSKTVPKGYWTHFMNDSEEVTRVVDWLNEQLSIKNLDDWYRVSLSQIRRWMPIGSVKDLIMM